MESRRYFDIPWVDWAWLGALALWRVFISSQHGLGADEAHYALYGLRPALSYFDHPPLVGWIELLFLHLFPHVNWAVRLPAVLLSFISSLVVYKICLFAVRVDAADAAKANDWAARFGVIALNASFIPAAVGFMMLPDSPLFLLELWLFLIARNLVLRDRVRDWLWLGVCLGLCGLCKYNAIFFVPSLIGIAWTEKVNSRHTWRRVALTTLTAAALITPVLIWNGQHDWLSFRYQLNHLAGHAHFSYKRFGQFLLTQFGIFSPFLVALVIYAVSKKKIRQSLEMRLALWFASPMLLFFAYSSWHEAILLHWTFVAWGLMIPLAVALCWQKLSPRVVKISVLTTAVITVFLLLELSFSFLKFPAYRSPYNDLVGWQTMHRELRGILEQTNFKDGYAIGVPNWSLGSRANFYWDDLARVYVLDDRFDQFDLWEKGPPHTRNILVVETHQFKLLQSFRKSCKSFDPVKRVIITRHGTPVTSFQISWCRGYSPPNIHLSL